MKTKTTTVIETTVSQIPVNKILRNKYNPRKTFSEEELKELAESIKANGLIQPITVRPVGNETYEIVCGERRYRAAVIAELNTITAIIKELSDEAAEEFAIVENLQRRDILPAEEATAFNKLIKSGKYTFETLAEKVGKSQMFIRSRIKLVALISPFVDLLNNDDVSIAVAGLLANYSKDQQEEIYNRYYKGDSGYYSLRGKKFSDVENTLDRDYCAEIDKFNFDKSVCINCPFNTYNFVLFGADGKGLCTKKECMSEKIKEYMKNEFRILTENNPSMPIVTSRYGGLDKEIADNLEIESADEVPYVYQVDEVVMPEQPVRENFEDEEDWEDALEEYQQTVEDKVDFEEQLLNGDIVKAVIISKDIVQIGYINASDAEIKSKTSRGGESSPIEKLQAKIVRNNELCTEKIIEEVKAELKIQKSVESVLNVDEEVMFYFYLLKELPNSSLVNVLGKNVSYVKDSHIEIIKKLDESKKFYIMREYIKKNVIEGYVGLNNYSDSFLKLFSAMHLASSLSEIESKHIDIYNKRNTRLEERISEQRS